MLGGIFHFYSSFNRIFFSQTVETLIRRRIMHCLPMSHKKDAMLIYGLMHHFIIIDCLYIIRIIVGPVLDPN